MNIEIVQVAALTILLQLESPHNQQAWLGISGPLIEGR